MFYKYLNPDIKKSVRVKPYKNFGWNTRKQFQDLLGKDRVYSDMSMSSVYNRSKIIICTYPNTTFSEGMASGIPTILFFSKELNERNEVVRPLLDLLRDSKIIFYDPIEAALHLNSIWDNPFRWWNSSKVIKARNEYKNIALDLDKDWGKKWKTFLESVIEDL
jgi:putative transferase (TIGR04331 family)